MQQSLTHINGCSSQVPARAEEQSRECREQEYKDRFGNCKACKQCDAGQELSKVSTQCFTQVFYHILQANFKEST